MVDKEGWKGCSNVANSLCCCSLKLFPTLSVVLDISAKQIKAQKSMSPILCREFVKIVERTKFGSPRSVIY